MGESDITPPPPVLRRDQMQKTQLAAAEVKPGKMYTYFDESDDESDPQPTVATRCEVSYIGAATTSAPEKTDMQADRNNTESIEGETIEYNSALSLQDSTAIETNKKSQKVNVIDELEQPQD